MWILKSDVEMVGELSERCRSIRLSQNMTQQETAERAGIPLRTFRRFEQEGQISLERLVAVLRALNRAGELESLLEPVPVRDLRELESPKPMRKRARKS
jgi:transcriptional regulator with XRE-family HTH domain